MYSSVDVMIEHNNNQKELVTEATPRSGFFDHSGSTQMVNKKTDIDNRLKIRLEFSTSKIDFPIQLETGVYIVHLETNKGITQKKIIIR
jgi:hypothetical protein